MNLTFGHLLTVFLELSKLSKGNEVYLTTEKDHFVKFLNSKYLQKSLFYLNYNKNVTKDQLEQVEKSILHSSIQTHYKVVFVKYACKVNNDIKYYNLDIKIDDIKNLYNVLSLMYLLINDYTISENEDGIVIKTPVGNTRIINWNEGWYCSCKSYKDHSTCVHVKVPDIYLKHRSEYSIPITYTIK